MVTREIVYLSALVSIILAALYLVYIIYYKREENDNDDKFKKLFIKKQAR